MSSPLPALLIEAFTDVPMQGNGAAVVRLAEPVSDAWMAGLARSLNQSETAFLLPAPQGWLLRWFTPSCEVKLCGHATLAALVALRHWQDLPSDGATVFWTRSGPLPVALAEGVGSMDLPAGQLQHCEAPATLQQLLQEGLRSRVERFWRSDLGYSVALLDAQAALASWRFNPALLGPEEASGLVLMQPLANDAPRPSVAGRPADYQLRFFAPGLGIAEDPVTGSAHALVTPYWHERLGRSISVGWQCSDRPGGMVCEATSSGMIRLSGTGSVLWHGHLQLQSDCCGSAAATWQQLYGGV